MMTVAVFLAGLCALLPLLGLTPLAHATAPIVKGLSAIFQRIVMAGFAIAAGSGLLIALTQLATLITRNFFGVNFIWLQESATYFFGAMFLLAAGAVLLQDGHVRVDVFYSRFNAKQKAVVDLAGLYLFILPVCGLVLIAAGPYVAQSWATLERSSEESGIHAVYLLKSLIPTFGALLAMAAFVRARTLCEALTHVSADQ